MQRFISILLGISLSISIGYADSKIIHTLSDDPSYTSDALDVWQISEIELHGGSFINTGFAITVDFSTGNNAQNKDIFKVGMSSNQTFKKLFSISEKDNSLVFERLVQFGNRIKLHKVPSWNSNILERSKNYTLKVEIDETRLRYSICESGNNDPKKYEYEFYGLFSSYIKDELDMTKGIFSIALSTANDYQVQKIVVTTLGYGVGVKLPDPDTDEKAIRIKNENSGKYMALYASSTIPNNIIVQHSSQPTTADKWVFRPVFQASRTPINYKLRLTNIASNLFLSIDNCSIYNGTPLVNSPNTTCNTWAVNREMIRTGYFKLMNQYNATYAVVSNASLDEDAVVCEWDNGSTHNAHWTFEEISIPTPITEGCYYIKNKNSSLYIQPAINSYESTTLIQNTANPLGNRVWYVSKDKTGLYTIQNMDSKKVIAVQDASLADGANIIQASSSGAGNEKWIITKEPNSIYHTIKNTRSDKYMVVHNASTQPGTGIIQYSTGENNKLWEFVPAGTYSSKTPPGGLYKLKGKYTDLYLVVENASKLDNARLISWRTADTPNAWWSIVKLNNGSYALRNAGSQLYLVIQNASIDENGPAVQYNRDGENNHGNSQWFLEHDDAYPNFYLYWLKNVHSGKYLYFQNEAYVDGTPAVQVTPNPDLLSKYRWELIPITE